MCIKRYVDCSRRGGFNPKDKCRQTCMNKKEDLTKPKIPKELERPDAIKLNDVEVKKMEGEVAAFFKMGAVGMKAWTSFIKKQYKMYMEWNLKYRQERDNLQFKYRMNYYRTRFGYYRKAFYIAKKKDMELNKKKYEEEAKKKQEAEVKKQEAEKKAFEK
jgi:hypothetical protein